MTEFKAGLSQLCIYVLKHESDFITFFTAVLHGFTKELF